ncbi:hypothetical protein GCM10009765_63620 [Fodinicola feengrottensis]|uniref:Peptidase C51 domain-containing protein n=1 Tax=Fodinicola feengrottensis TaxID=435914 RepID=A0ABN2IIW2_9ACTN
MLLGTLAAVAMAVTATSSSAYADSSSVAAPAKATRAGIRSMANAQVGKSCTSFTTAGGTSACQNWWCAVFASWVWRHAGVTPAPTTWVATDVGTWGKAHHVFKARPAGQRGNPLVGDIVVFGQPGAGTGGHVGIVTAVYSNGYIDTMNGDYGSGGPGSTHVVKSHINPITARSGGSNWLISGYVSPPGV